MNSLTSRRKRKPLRRRAPLSPQQIEERRRLRDQRAYEKRIRSLFERMGFLRFKTDAQHFSFYDRTGELDDIFLYENVLVIAEYYTGKPDTSHLLKKMPLYGNILSHPEEFTRDLFTRLPALAAAMKQVYRPSDVRIKIIYATKLDPSSELEDNCPGVTFLYGVLERYFAALIKTIERSARNEFFRFLGLEFKDIGLACFTSSRNFTNYEGFLLPEGQSSYPRNYKIVSFYADPERLMQKCYVLRQDGWRDEPGLYQRILVADKIRKMRTYLSHQRRVYVNNVIVTLPPGTSINDIENPGRNLPDSGLAQVKPVSIQIPSDFDSIGVIDGQHRIFCYHEGTDKPEETISVLRKQQTLLVTGIVYPPSASDAEKRRFEARLFVEINNNQTRVKSALTQEIELILQPYSSISLAKRVAKELTKRGPYKGLLQTGFFDDPEKIKVTSIVSYGLKPLVKMDGNDSLFAVWGGKDRARDTGGEINPLEAEKYITFCVEKINEFMLAAKLAHGTDGWGLGTKPRSPLLKPTVINGLIVCLRKVIASGLPLESDFHKSKLNRITRVNFDAYKSSQWQRLGKAIFEECYGEPSALMGGATAITVE